MEVIYISKILIGRIVTSGMSGTIFKYQSDSDLVGIVEGLIDNDVPFFYESEGSSPVAVLQSLIEKKLLTKTFKAISWIDPDDYQIYDMPAC